VEQKYALVVGGDGYLGTEFANCLKFEGFQVFSVGRKSQMPVRMSFDLIVYAHGSRGYSSNKSEVSNFLDTIDFFENKYKSLKSILFSSTRIEREPKSNYSLGRLQGEKVILARSPNNIVMRLSNVVSFNMPQTSFIGRIIHIANTKNLPHLRIEIAPAEKRDYIHKTDLGLIFHEIINNPNGGRVRIGNIDEISNLEIIQQLNLDNIATYLEQTNTLEPDKMASFEYDFYVPSPSLNSLNSILACVEF
jgi:nucleoside-diphosphate-sugar epimerase